MGYNPWGDSKQLFGASQTGANYGGQGSPNVSGTPYSGTPGINQQQQQQQGFQAPPNAAGTPYWNPNAQPYQPPPPGASEGVGSHGSWGGITNLPQVQAQTAQNFKNNSYKSLLDQGQAQGDVAYQQALINLQQQMGVTWDKSNWNKEGNQLTHDQNQAMNNMVIGNFGRDTSFIERALGLAGNTRDQDMARQGLSDQGLDLQGQDLLTNLYRSRRQLNNQYTAGGGWFTPERGLSQTDLNKGWETQQGQLNINRAGNQINRQSIGTQYDQAQLAHDKALAAAGDQDAIARLKNQFGDQDLAHANAGVGLDLAGAGLQNGNQQIQLSAQQAQQQQQYLKMLHDAGLA